MAIVCLLSDVWQPFVHPYAGLGTLVCTFAGAAIGIVAQLDIRRSDGTLRGRELAGFRGSGRRAALRVGGLLFQATTIYCGPAMRRAQSVNNLKQIGLALSSYHETYGRFPPAAVFDQKGHALYSWRVLLLPFLEQQDLYKEFHLDEAWNSPHNQALVSRMPAVYHLPHRRTYEEPRGTTFILVFVGKGMVLESQGDAAQGIVDAAGSTLMAVEARTSVPWSMPMDLPFMANAQVPTLGGTERHRFGPDTPRDGFLVVYVDGSTEFRQRPDQSDEAAPALRAAITRNGLEPISPADRFYADFGRRP